MISVDERRARFELARRLRIRKRKAEGLPVHTLNGATGKYNVPSRKTVEAGVEAKRAQKVPVTLPKLNLPELGDDA